MIATKAFWILTAAFLATLVAHVLFLGSGLDQLDRETEFLYEQSIEINSAPGEFRVRMFLPRADHRTRIREEVLETADLDVDFLTTDAGRTLVVTGHAGSLPRTITYRAGLVTQAVSFRTSGSPEWRLAAGTDSLNLRPSEHIQVGHPSLLTPLREIVGIPGAESGDQPTEAWTGPEWQTAFGRHQLSPQIVIARIFSYCNDQIAPARFSGTTDALTTLQLGEASCGGKSRLMTALCRTVGIPSRLVGGVIIGQSGRKRTHHVWIECRQGDLWVPFDPLNGHFAALPENYLRLYTGDEPLISYSRGLAFDYGFKSPRRTVPKAWSEAGDLDAEIEESGFLSSLTNQTIPLLERGGFSLILLAPFALLLIVFVRQVVGMESIGVFLPILLGFSLTQTGLLYGSAQILLCLGLGSLLRLLMARLNLLHVSRAAVMITSVIVLFLAFSVLQRLVGYEPNSGELILPLAALAMAIEKFILVAMDKGTAGALWLLIQTLLLALGCSVILAGSFYQQLMIAFPEILLLVIGLIIVVGNYRGLRWKEHLRFGSLLRPGGER
jgi:7 transmembrane helices usually fused to an inactive transglutaminase/Transglutaminase-like superfamily